jgi:hypothetical protein
MKHIIFSGLYLIALFILSKFIFEPTYLYYEFWWLDIPMHILGGVGVAFFAASILTYKQKKLSFIKIVLAYVVVASIWEVYEYAHDVFTSQDWNGWFDTTKDIIDGFVGASVAYYFIKK